MVDRLEEQIDLGGETAKYIMCTKQKKNANKKNANEVIATRAPGAIMTPNCFKGDVTRDDF